MINDPPQLNVTSFIDFDTRLIDLTVSGVLEPGNYENVILMPIEDVRAEHHDRYLWGNASFALAGRMTESFANYGWYNNMVGPQSGGTVPNLPLHQYEATGQYHTKIPTEALISEIPEEQAGAAMAQGSPGGMGGMY